VSRLSVVVRQERVSLPLPCLRYQVKKEVNPQRLLESHRLGYMTRKVADVMGQRWPQTKRKMYKLGTRIIQERHACVLKR
jgi:hypothetical protein